MLIHQVILYDLISDPQFSFQIIRLDFFKSLNVER